GDVGLARAIHEHVPVSIEAGTYTVSSRQYFVASRSVSADRADVEHVAVVARFQGNAQLPAGRGLGHDRRDGDDVLASGVVERRFHAALLAELDQVAGSRERQLEAAG